MIPRQLDNTEQVIVDQARELEIMSNTQGWKILCEWLKENKQALLEKKFAFQEREYYNAEGDVIRINKVLSYPEALIAERKRLLSEEE